MTDLEWMKAIKDYAFAHGSYTLSPFESRRLLTFIPINESHLRNFLHTRAWRDISVNANTVMVWDLCEAAERGMVEAVTRKLVE